MYDNLTLRHNNRWPTVPTGPDRGDFFFDGDVKYLSIKENNGVERLALCGSRDLTTSSQMAKVRFGLLFAHIFWVSTGAMKFDIPNNPVTISFFGAKGNRKGRPYKKIKSFSGVVEDMLIKMAIKRGQDLTSNANIRYTGTSRRCAPFVR